MCLTPCSGRIKNVVDLGRNDRIGKVFEFAESHFFRDIESDLCIRVIFPYRDSNRILNHCLWNRMQLIKVIKDLERGNIGEECMQVLSDCT